MTSYVVGDFLARARELLLAKVEVTWLLVELWRWEPKARNGLLYASPTIKLECGAPNRGDQKISLIPSHGQGDRREKNEGVDASRFGALQGIETHVVGWTPKAAILIGVPKWRLVGAIVIQGEWSHSVLGCRRC
jgi:hypothetical protein